MIELLHDFWFLVFAAVTLTSVSATLAQAWQKTRRVQAEAALKREMLQRELSVDEIERLLHPPEAPLSEEAAYRALGESLASLTLAGPALEEVMATFRAAELPAKRALVQTMRGIGEGGGELDEEWLLALVRGLCVGASGTRSAPGPVNEFITELPK